LHFINPKILLFAILLWDGGGPSAIAFGGPGGSAFRITCRSDGVLVGLSASYGDWIDGVVAILEKNMLPAQSVVLGAGYTLKRDVLRAWWLQASGADTVCT
jgi:hypothetical protein